MLSFKERLELLEHDLKSSPPAFTMSSDLPFAIFRYDPTLDSEDEWHVRRDLSKLATRVTHSTGKRVNLVPLSELYWKSIAESEGLEALAQLERDHGFLAAEAQVNSYLTDWRPITNLLVDRLSGFDPATDIVFLTRAGVFAPSSYRVSALLEQLMGLVRIPTVMFYPGTWRGSLNYLGLRSDDEPLGSYRVKIYGRDE